MSFRKPSEMYLEFFVVCVLIAITALVYPHCEDSYRTCRETCTRQSAKCGVSVERCVEACEGLAQDAFVELTECVWAAPRCAVALSCWPGEESAPWQAD